MNLAGRAAEELLDGVARFGLESEPHAGANDDEWFESMCALDSDLRDACECIHIAYPRGRREIERLRREYVVTREFLRANWRRVEALAAALLENDTIHDPYEVLQADGQPVALERRLWDGTLRHADARRRLRRALARVRKPG